jgi:hypothetical protein
MPYEVVASVAGGKKGFRVRKVNTRIYYSEEALPKKRAEAQATAIRLSELRKEGRIPPRTK